MVIKGGAQHSIVALSTLITHIIYMTLRSFNLEDNVMISVKDFFNSDK